jgi:predicted  nucleic acid-binding Zn-ribbon protein
MESDPQQSPAVRNAMARFHDRLALHKAEERIAALEAENASLRERVQELEDWRDRVKESVRETERRLNVILARF